MLDIGNGGTPHFQEAIGSHFQPICCKWKSPGQPPQIAKAIFMDMKGALAGWTSRMPQTRSRWKNFRLNTRRSGGHESYLEDGDYGGVSVRDSSGNVLCGVRLQLKLVFSA